MKMVKKLIIFAAVAVLLAGMYLTDVIISNKYEFELLSNQNATVVADGESVLRFTARLTKSGKPVEGHVIYIYVSNGSLPVSRFVTDDDGEITFRYYPYVFLDERLTPLEDVSITLQDESNSVFFMVSAAKTYDFKAVKPDEENVWKDWQGLK